MLAARMCAAYTQSSASIIYPFLDITPGARAAALADSVTGMDGDAGAAFANPALLAGVTAAQVSMTYGKWLVDSNYQDISGAYKYGAGTFGGQLLYMNHGSFEKRDGSGTLLAGTLGSYDIAVSTGYGFYPAKDLSAGAALKVMGQSVASSSRAGFCADAGAAYRCGNTHFGGALNNIGAVSGFGFPLTLRLGTASDFNITAGHNVTLGLDMKYIWNEGMSFSTGAEYSYASVLFARAGYRLREDTSGYDAASGFTMGAGLRVSGFMFDYALVPFGDLGLTHRVTVSYSFARPVKAGNSGKPAAGKLDAGQMGKVPELVKYYNKVNEDKNNVEAWKNLARAYEKAGNMKYALSSVEKALKIAPRDGELLELRKKYRALAGDDGKKPADKQQ